MRLLGFITIFVVIINPIVIGLGNTEIIKYCHFVDIMANPMGW